MPCSRHSAATDSADDASTCAATYRLSVAAAVRAFKAAAERAPQWGRLHLVWGEAEAGRGRSDTARALWTKAAGMDLSPTDRGQVEARLAAAH